MYSPFAVWAGQCTAAQLAIGGGIKSKLGLLAYFECQALKLESNCASLKRAQVCHVLGSLPWLQLAGAYG